jgi:uncharacterized protein (TIGR02118 family)
MVSLARRFGDARVRLFVGDDAGREGTPPASFDVIVVVERERARWGPPAGSTQTQERDDALAWLAGARGYRATVRAPKPRAVPLAPGKRSAGIVFAATALRAPQLSHAEFDAHWRDVHGPLALRHHVGMTAYEQLAVESALTATAAPIDGLALLHFPDRTALETRFYDSDAGRAAIRADTDRFLDLARCEAVLMSEWGVRV